MRWTGVVVLAGALGAVGWTPVPTRPPARTATPRPAATPTPPAVSPTPSPTRAASATPTPAGQCLAVREYWIQPSVPVLTPQVGQSLRFADGTEFVILIRHAGLGDVPYRMVRVK